MLGICTARSELQTQQEKQRPVRSWSTGCGDPNPGPHTPQVTVAQEVQAQGQGNTREDRERGASTQRCFWGDCRLPCCVPPTLSLPGLPSCHHLPDIIPLCPVPAPKLSQYAAHQSCRASGHEGNACKELFPETQRQMDRRQTSTNCRQHGRAWRMSPLLQLSLFLSLHLSFSPSASLSTSPSLHFSISHVCLHLSLYPHLHISMSPHL